MKYTVEVTDEQAESLELRYPSVRAEYPDTLAFVGAMIESWCQERWKDAFAQRDAQAVEGLNATDKEIYDAVIAYRREGVIK